MMRLDAAHAVNTTMYYLYGSKTSAPRKLVATFDSKPLLLSYLHWATLKTNPDGTKKFEQGSPLVGYTGYVYSAQPLTEDNPNEVVHNPSPSML